MPASVVAADTAWTEGAAVGSTARQGLAPERQPLETLDQIRRTIGEYPRTLRPGGAGRDARLFKRAGSGPSSDAGIWHLDKERYEAQPPKLQPLSTLFPRLRRW